MVQCVEFDQTFVCLRKIGKLIFFGTYSPLTDNGFNVCSHRRALIMTSTTQKAEANLFVTEMLSTFREAKVVLVGFTAH